MELGGEDVFAGGGAGGGGGGGAEEGFVGDGFEVFGVGGDEVVESGGWGEEGGGEGGPGGFDYFEEDVVLQLACEVDHFGDGATGAFPVWGGGGGRGEGEDAAGAGHAAAPGGAEAEFDAFDPPEEVEDFEVLAVGPGGDEDVDWGVDFVFEGENVPACVAFFHFGQAGVEAAEDVGGVVLGVGVADGVLELGG